MPTLAGSFLVVSAASDTSTLTTSSFTPAAGDLIVVKTAAEINGSTFATPTDTQGNTYTVWASDSTLGSHPFAGLATAVVGSGSSMTVSATNTSFPAFHSMVVEWWTTATLAVSPAVVDNRGSGSPSTTLTTTAAGSAVSWVNVDWNANSPTGRVYDSTSATPTEEGIHNKSTGNYVSYFAWQAAASAGSQTIGMTAPSGQVWTLVGIEILDASPVGPGAQDPDQFGTLAWQ
jgi:hypothetical protein